jgi:uncharacterized protein CbrC (UPF0167 family)
MTFTYFDKAEKYSPLSEEAVSCDLCRMEKVCFDAELYYGTDQIDYICPECLAAGKLNDRDIFTCEGDIDELRRQLVVIHPDWSDAQIEGLAAEKTSVLEKTTPHLVSWQDWVWPCAEGDYCRFIGFGSKTLYASMAPGTDGMVLFKNSFYHTVADDVDVDEFWDDLLPEEDIADYNESADLPVLFYVFKSLHSDRIVTIWDSN